MTARRFRTVKLLIAAGMLATVLHFADNTLAIERYPEPGWITPFGVVASWFVVTALAVVALVRRTADGAFFAAAGGRAECEPAMKRSLTLHSALVASVAVALAAAFGGGVRADEAVRPPLVDRALRLFAAETHGIVGYRARLATVAHALGRITHADVTAGYLLVDGTLVAAKVYRVTADGSDAPAIATQKLQDAYDRRIAAPDRPPLREAAAADYRYEAVACADCEPGVAQVKFTSLVRDTHHLDGMLWIQQSTARPLKMTSQPAVLPSPATSAEATTTFGAVSGGGWGVIRSQQHTTARVFVMNVSSDTTETEEHHRRFATVEEGRKAVEDGTV